MLKLLCDTLLDAYPGLAENIKVLGADGEDIAINQTCTAFPNAMLLVCVKHIVENIREFSEKYNWLTQKKKFLFMFLVIIQRKS